MEDHPSIRQLMDEERTSEDLEAKLKELEEDIEEIQGLLEKPESDGIQIIETEGGERQVIVHWLTDAGVTDLAGAESAFQNCDPISDPYAVGSSGREAGHGDLLVLDTGACLYIAYVVNVDRVAPKHSGLQAEAPTTDHALSIGTPPRKELIIWNTCTGEGGGDDCSHAHADDVEAAAPLGTRDISVPTVNSTPVPELFQQTSNTQVSLFRDYNVTTAATPINVSASGTTQVPVSIHADAYRVSIFNDDWKRYHQYLINDITFDEDPVRLPTDAQTVSIGTAFEGATWRTQTLAGDNFFRVSQPNTIPLKAITVSLCHNGQPTSVTLFALRAVGDSEPIAGHLMANKDGVGAEIGTVTDEIIIPKFDVSIWSTATVSIAANWSDQTVTRNLDVDWDNNEKAITSLGTRSVFDVLKNLRATSWADVVDSVTGSATVDLPTGITPDNLSKVIINNRAGTTVPASSVTVSLYTETVVTNNGNVTAAGAAEPCVSVYNPT